ncbi:hypothetical protein D8674_038103 [Pyrus ussuriensis x Pyrus communis]|uniref:Uncharacterized protein n=1 Tax=Pyrus ussuriensis x Pyrus communis TaxID=2448454 RepID=A0A5N5I4F3_9ROSA|nr:hypothetical protein D8674_038103 [Pyrus ussuriensis x Pyrus communis]
MKSKLKDNYWVKVRYIQLWRARQKTKKVIEGKHAACYGKLRRYGNEVLKSNPGSIMKIQVDKRLGYPSFKHCFICFASMRDAISLDSSSGVFPIAMEVVELECKDNWTFFMIHLETMIGSHNSNNIPWTSMLDRQKVALLLFCFLTCFD